MSLESLEHLDAFGGDQIDHIDSYCKENGISPEELSDFERHLIETGNADCILTKSELDFIHSGSSIDVETNKEDLPAVFDISQETHDISLNALESLKDQKTPANPAKALSESEINIDEGSTEQITLNYLRELAKRSSNVDPKTLETFQQRLNALNI